MRLPVTSYSGWIQYKLPNGCKPSTSYIPGSYNPIPTRILSGVLPALYGIVAHLLSLERPVTPVTLLPKTKIQSVSLVLRLAAYPLGGHYLKPTTGAQIFVRNLPSTGLANYANDYCKQPMQLGCFRTSKSNQTFWKLNRKMFS